MSLEKIERKKGINVVSFGGAHKGGGGWGPPNGFYSGFALIYHFQSDYRKFSKRKPKKFSRPT